MSRPNLAIYKYPRTHHLAGSRLQPGDEDLDSVPFQMLAGRYLVVEEKMDGANAALSFRPDGELLLQSRGHYLTGGEREIHFALFKQWAYTHAAAFWPVLGDRYVMYGEWLYAKHTIFYDHLPHYFMEFDVLDKQMHQFLSTKRRQELLAGLPVAPVKVLSEGKLQNLEQLTGLMGPSHFIQPEHLNRLRSLCESRGLNIQRTLQETDPTPDMEGLYLKIEEAGEVKARYKYIRASFLTNVLESGSHWLNRPIVPNQLAPGVDIFAES